jgi:hypothetical protein
MPVFEVSSKRSSVQYCETQEDAIRMFIEELIDAWNDGCEITEIFEIEAVECGDEPTA